MSAPQIPAQALLFLSIFSSRWELFWPALETELTGAFGPVGRCAGPLPFEVTDYYHAEFGQPLTRRLLVFETLIDQDRLVEIKLRANQIEQEFAARLASEGAARFGGRLFNLDPGLLNMERLVLATGKNYTHRIYLGQGIWAELTLYYQHGAWRSLPWTFPDYASPQIQAHLTDMREYYRQKRVL